MSYAITLEERTPTDERVVYGSIETTSELMPRTTMAQTPLAQRVLSRLELVILPLALAASISSPDLRRQSTRTIGKVDESQSTVNFVYATHDMWELTREFVAIEEIRALNELLAMPTSEGSRFELDPD